MLITSLSLAQDNIPTVLPPSPNAASLGTYGQIPVSLFNGLPEISIPLGSVKESDANVNISLGYHGGGIHPDDHPGWVGLGWNLNAGGVITRRVAGGVDENIEPNFNPETRYSYYNNFSYLDNAAWSSETSLRTLKTGVGIALPDPDEFIFNFGGYSGSFYLNQKGKWQVKSTDPVHIDIKEQLMDNFELAPQATGTPITIRRIFYTFTLTVPDGTKYIFGGTPESIEFTRGPGAKNNYNSSVIPTSWFLTKVISPKQREVIFRYQRGNIIAPLSSGLSIYSAETVTGTNGSRRGGIQTSLSIINPVYLAEIETVHQKIKFSRSISNELPYNYDLVSSSLETIAMEYEDLSRNMKAPAVKANIAWQKLDSISFYTKGSKLLKKFTFAYFENPSSRLMLQSIQQSGNSGELNNPYKFSYTAGLLPEYNSNKLDHWGYYNGRNWFSEQPQYTGQDLWTYVYNKNNVVAYSESRSSNFQMMRIGNLESIQYPTGGFTHFEFEPHEYSNIAKRYPFTVESTGNTLSGGLRIRKMWDEDVLGVKSNLKEYKYLLNYNSAGTKSSGILGGIPVYLEQGRGYYSDNGYIDFWNWYSYSIQPLSYTNGNHITYTEVIEKLEDGSYTISNYSNHDQSKYRDKPYVSAIHPSIPGIWNLDPNISMALDRGKVLQKRVFKAGNILQQETTYEYNESLLRDDPSAIRIVNLRERSFSLGATVLDNRLTANLIYTFPRLIDKVVERSYVSTSGQQNVLSKETRYLYDPVTLNVTQESYIDSKQIQKKTQYKYSNDMVTSDQNYIYNKMYNAHRLSQIIEKRTFANDVLVTLDRTSYINPFPNIFVPQKIERQNGTGAIYEGIRFNLYDSYGNILSLTEKGKQTNYIWSYNSIFPIAEIKNLDYSMVETTLQKQKIEAINLLNPDSTAVESFLSPLRIQKPEAFVTSLSFEPGVGFRSQTDINKLPTHYEYDGLQRLKKVRNYNGFITNAYKYNYATITPVVYTNDERTASFTRNNCEPGQTGSSFLYVVPSGKYSANTKAEANAMADAEIASQGQIVANGRGSCSLQPGLTMIVKNAFSQQINFIITIDGYSPTGPRSVGGNSTTILNTGFGPVNPSTLTIKVYPEGYFPSFATAKGFWGTKQGTIDFATRTITFTGLNLTQTQSFEILLN